MIDILLLSVNIIAIQACPTRHIYFVIYYKKLFSIFELFIEPLLIAEEIKTTETITGENEDMLVLNS